MLVVLPPPRPLALDPNLLVSRSGRFRGVQQRSRSSWSRTDLPLGDATGMTDVSRFGFDDEPWLLRSKDELAVGFVNGEEWQGCRSRGCGHAQLDSCRVRVRAVGVKGLSARERSRTQPCGGLRDEIKGLNQRVCPSRPGQIWVGPRGC